jgi:hypothetical protein
VPNRHLERWQRRREEHRGLPFEEFLEIAALSDQQLGSDIVAEAVEHCWGLREWHFLGGSKRGDPLFRSLARYLAILSPDQLRQAMRAEGLPFRSLTPAQQQATLQHHEQTMLDSERQWGKRSMNIRPEDFLNAEIIAEYVPAGWFVWTPPAEVEARPRLRPLTPIAGPTAAAALAEARKIEPTASPNQIGESKEGNFSGGIRFVFRQAAP